MVYYYKCAIICRSRECLFKVISKVALTPTVFGPGNPAPYSISPCQPKG